MSKFCDPGFRRGRALAQVLGMATLIIADSIILPFDHRETAESLALHSAAIHRLAINTHQHIDMSLLDWAISSFTSSALALHQRITSAHALTEHDIDDINRRLFKTELAFLFPGGIPGRPWY